ncbi:ABC-type Mn2+/Zn2+ transport system ATPase subunit [Xanthomonas campestris]|uniref:AAA family ATPase n=1 Tax=Xanthomonas campestris TaxID=339 RepID=UPI002169F3D0|nr:AAA family ATPase [Xanthomonas campestris]MCS3848409.1 ABC-type Mn2+/Zn2+ transport system ATPase subunit [Xanthomonas campestris]
MVTLSFDLENCYGIRKLRQDVRLDRNGCAAIYAPNGSMKTSLAKCLQDLSKGVDSSDQIFNDRITKRGILLDQQELQSAGVFVVRSYDEMFSNSEKTAMLLVNHELRLRYEEQMGSILKAKEALLKALKKASGIRRDIEREISQVFVRNDKAFVTALRRVREEVQAEPAQDFSKIPYEVLFGDKSAAFLEKPDVKAAISGYIKNYNALLSRSTYFRKGVFNYFNASTIAKNLADNGFFNAQHTIRLNGAAEPEEVRDRQQLEQIIVTERDQILNDPTLRKSFESIEKSINVNADLRDLHAFLLENEEIVPELENMESLRQKTWISYLRACASEYKTFLEREAECAGALKAIEDQAAQESTQWSEVIRIFNERFSVPFRLEVQNRILVMLGQESAPTLGFRFEDGNGDIAEVDRSRLMGTLSTGELKALYILNVIFEIEIRRQQGEATVFVVDDIADSFDYKNKYAIIEYLREMSEDPKFLQLVLTHNFDFFRTTQSRYVERNSCYMAVKGPTEVRLESAYALKGIFPIWRDNFFVNPKMKIACIPFIRNLIEYIADDQDPNYLKLTSMLHIRAGTADIKISDLDGIFRDIFGKQGAPDEANKGVVDLIKETAAACLDEPEGINLENKIVLSLGIRLVAEEFMIAKINDPEEVAKITSSQTGRLHQLYRQRVGDADREAVDVLRKVMLMTPESIHLNSFMYEPILDMADDHLRKLYRRVCALA